jgi:hypothetical protein
VDRSEILALYDRELRIDIEYPGVRKEVTPHVVRFLRPAPGGNFVQYSWLDADNADRVIAEQIAELKPLGQKLSWNVHSHDSPPDLRDRLVAHGFTPDEPGTIMVLDLEALPRELRAPPVADVRRLTTREELDAVVQIEEAVWGGNFGWIRQRLGDHLEIPDYLGVYVAYVDAEPGCAGWTYFHAGTHFGSLYGGSTVPNRRGRGLYTAVLAARAQEAMARGVRFLVVDANANSGPIVARHGFQALTRSLSCDLGG